MSQQSKPTSFLVLLVVLAVTLMLVSSLLTPNTAQSLQYSDVLDLFRDEKVASFTLEGSNLTMQVRSDDGDTASTVTAKIGNTEQFREDLDALIADQYADGTLESYNYLPVSEPWYRAAAPYIIGGVVLIALFFFLSSRANGGPNGMANFTKANARFGIPTSQTVTFQDVAGADEEKEELAQIVDFLRDPKRYSRLGAKIPKGVLLVGPPGTGKTMLARAVAGEADVPFFSISGSEFVEMFVGVGASRVRDLFEKAKKNSPCIIFIDEIDAVGRRRGSGMGGGHDEREQTLNQILVEMDGFEKGQNVIVLAATNRADVLDPALLRPGRFDRRVNISLPERKDRLAILKVHFENKPADKDIDLDALAAKTAGSSGADLANVANEAAIRAARQNRKTINNDDLTAAFEKVAIGPERKSKVMNEHDRELTAYHEGGHALVAQVLPDSDNVHKVTIIPRGGTGGVTWTIPPEDRPYTSVVEFKDILARALGGRIAEEIVYGRDKITTGAGSDLRSATAVARDMIIEQGMGTKLRDQVFHEDEGGLMMDRITREKPYSDKTAEEIDREVNELIEEAANRARAVISGNRKFLDEIKDALLKDETLDSEKVAEIFKGAKLPDSAKLY